MSDWINPMNEARVALGARFEETWRVVWARDPLKSQVLAFVQAEVDAAVKVAREDAEANAKRAEAAECAAKTEQEDASREREAKIAWRRRAEAAEAKVARLKEELRAARCAHDSLKDTLAKKPPEPYTPRAGDVVRFSDRHPDYERVIVRWDDFVRRVAVVSQPGDPYSYECCGSRDPIFIRRATGPERERAGLNASEWDGVLHRAVRVMASEPNCPLIGQVRRVQGWRREAGFPLVQEDDTKPNHSGPYWTATKWEPATPAERAAAGLPPEAPAAPKVEVLPEHLAFLEALADYWGSSHGSDIGAAGRTAIADALRAAVARRDGGGK